ncbi:MAG: GNAT family N-acetyltransferase [Phycisphaerae bacterium]|nr:GNAT family N-acetyltransferase [Phycisphaerae bacterium]
MLEGPHIILRLFTDDDVDDFLKIENTYAEKGELDYVDLRCPVAFRKHLAETGGWDDKLGRMLITDKSGRMLGHIMFMKEPSYQSGYEIGFAVFRREDRGKGYTTEALRIFSAYLFELKPIPRLQLGTHVDNIAARRVAEKCGYKLEGTLRQMFFARGKYVDCVLYSLLRDECASLAEALKP